MGDARAIAPDQPMVMMTTDQLRVLVQTAVRDVLGNSNGQKEYLGTAEVCEWLDLDPKTLTKYVRSEGLPALQLGPRQFRFRRESVIAWLEARATKPGGHVSKHVERLKRAKAGG